MKSLLRLQVAYAITGILYNAASYATLQLHGFTLAPTAPITGALVMGAYYLCLLPGFMGYRTAYRVLMCFAIAVFGYGGIVVHILNYPGNLHLYASTAAWAAAIGINAAGLVLNFLGASGLFLKKERSEG
ncbi:MAG: hypothetical protein EPN93_15845 [Spirochaetes bacterium]|nr:MAG: hypothetical protein EPN93_15845 [Spirochaetota bacterium]